MGIDLVGTRRMAALLDCHGDRFLVRCFRVFVASDSPSTKPDPEEIAGMWAAKEAFLKALGSDVRGIPYRDIEIIGSGSRAYGVRLHGKAQEALIRSGAGKVHLSIGHAGDLAVATVLLEK